MRHGAVLDMGDDEEARLDILLADQVPPPYPRVWTQHLYTPERHGRRTSSLMHYLIGKLVLGLRPSVTINKCMN